MKTLGIDLATEPAATGLCVIEWGARVPRASFPAQERSEPRDNTRLLSLMEDDECARTAIDAAFGWPEQFRKALDRYAREYRWKTWRATEEFDEKRSWLGRRRTDYFVHKKTEEEGVKITPFSVGASHFSATAMRCAELLDAYYKDKGNLERVDGPVIETYPAAARVRWAHSSASAKKPDEKSEREWRHAWLRLIKHTCKLELKPAERERVAAQPGGHDFDALLCALVARAAGDREGTLGPSTKEDAQLAKREGWIHMPKCSLSDLPESRFGAEV